MQNSLLFYNQQHHIPVHKNSTNDYKKSIIAYFFITGSAGAGDLAAVLSLGVPGGPTV